MASDDDRTITLLREQIRAVAPAVPYADVVRHGRALRHRRRTGRVVGATLGLAAVAVGVVAGLDLQSARHVTHVQAAAGPPAALGGLAFTVTEDTADEGAGRVRCALTIHFAPGSSPATTGFPCLDDFAAQDAQLRAEIARGDHPAVGPGQDPALGVVESRDDRVRADGHAFEAVTGTAPHDAVAVVATDLLGRTLTATLVRPPFTPLVVWGMRTSGHRLTGVRYVLRDGRQGAEQELSLG